MHLLKLYRSRNYTSSRIEIFANAFFSAIVQFGPRPSGRDDAKSRQFNSTITEKKNAHTNNVSEFAA